MKIKFTRSLLLSLLVLPSGVGAHRTFPQGITCGSQFSSPQTPLVIPNPEISWANYHIYACDDPVMWYEADVDEDQPIYFTLTVPELERFKDARMGVAFFGPGLPPLEQDNVFLPDDLKTYAAESGLGVFTFASPYDQSTCSHLTSSAMIQSTTVKDGRCHFYEPYGGSNMWVVMDEEVKAPSKGTYKIAVFEQNGNTAKASFACCDWPEDFITQFDMPEPTCEVCGSNADNPAWSSLFYEHKTMEPYSGYPPLQNCLADQTPILLPEGDMCPPIPSSGEESLQQLESCNLGCDSKGECHSHNVFGECTHILDWSLTPKFGDASVTNIIIFKGDKIRFTHDGGDGLVHNLYQIANEEALEVCDFTGSSDLAGVEEVRIGHDVTFDEAGVFYYTCSISCNIEMDESVMSVQQQGEASNFCHCSIGQKLTVEVKDATDGLQCHSHAQTDHNHGRRIDEAAVALECSQDTTNIRVVNNPTYGAMNENECSEQCAVEFALQFIVGAELGSCVDIGYADSAVIKTLRPPGSPRAIEVRVTSKIEEVQPVVALECPQGTTNARAINNPDYGAMGEDECAEQCAPEDDIPFMTGVESGSCVDLGYVHDATMRTVEPPLSQTSIRENAALRNPIEVRITSNEGEVDENCHCHSYEEIACPETETGEDTLYAEHIEEVEEYCQAILDGTETECPYKCFQPMEVLHLHYLECPSRIIDPTYIAVNDTNKCHIAAPAPPGADTCPVVELSNSADEDDNSGFNGSFSFDFKLPAAFVAAITVNAILGFLILVSLVILIARGCRCCAPKPDAAGAETKSEDAEIPKETFSAGVDGSSEDAEMPKGSIS